MSNLEELEQKYQELGKEIEKLKAEKTGRKIWRPKEGDRYFYSVVCRWKGLFTDSVEMSNNAPNKTFAIFETQDECDNFNKITEAIAELKQWQKVYGSGKWIIMLNDPLTNDLKTTEKLYLTERVCIGFSSQEACEEIIPKLTDNCKAYLKGEYS